MINTRKKDFTPLILLLAMIILWGIMHQWLGGSFFGPTFYNTYTLQALAWRDGLLHLPCDYPYLELAIFEGEFYVSFPPLPSVILFPLTFLFGNQTPDNLLVKLYAAAACLMMYVSFRRAGYSRLSGGLFSFLFCFASSLLPLTLNGAVWYHAQVLAFFLITAAICLLSMDFPAPALLCYALSVACRPFHAMYALPLFFVYWRLNQQAGLPIKTTARALLPGVILGLCVAAGLALYNFVRFGNPLEFGHNYLPEFSFQGGIQFSVHHVLNNLKTFLRGLPLEISNGAIAFKKFGYSMLIACPMLLLMIIYAIRDLIKKRMTWAKAVVMLSCFIHAFLLLLHRTFGGFQLGARYAVDLMPYAYFYLLISPEKKKLSIAEGIFLFLIFCFTLWGCSQVHI